MRRIVVLVVASLLAGLLVAAPPAQAEPVRIVLYGDSLSFEASKYVHSLSQAIAGLKVSVRARPGGATCDLFDQMARDARHLRPAFVVVQFSGNTLTPCVQDRAGNGLRGDAWLAKYRADTIRAIQLLRPMKATIYLASSPISLLSDRRGEHEAHKLAQMQREVAAGRRQVHAINSASAVLAHGKYWTDTLPCLPREPCTGGVDMNLNRVNRVRSADGAHFCPLPYREGAECMTWSAGAHRFALGMLIPGLYNARLFDTARFDRSTGAGFR